ncbi:HD domain-containing protein [Paraglaciecola sp. 20A4]|uniref:HD domain-containing protein n=1 Tax=Paraglaciecola sp. 20A4 TaxID=2687288 RepID=UPI00140D8861|nr:HD domain-containing protein [Paraglaciecola sp. 20A4]
MQDLAAQIAFILEIDKLKAVYRKTMVKADDNRNENSAEHSWHIALLAQTMATYAEHPINILRVTKMLLIHDIVEIDAGDLFAFADEEAHQAQEKKELEAAQRIFGLLPKALEKEMLNLWLEFEKADSVDAQFAKGMDRILPIFQNMSNNGGSWKVHNVCKAQVLKRNGYLRSSAPKLWEYVKQQVDVAVKKGWLLDG